MATIALYAGKLNQMPGLIQEVKKSVVDYKSELEALKNKTLQIDRNVCELKEVISSIQASSRIQDEKIASLEALESESEQFIEETVRIDSEVAEVIRQRQDDFYDAYNYLKPDCEKNGWEKFCSFCKNAGEWCREHWGEILVTFVIVIGAVLAIATVIVTGGMALVPMLSAMFTTIGISAGTALTVATAISLTVAGVAITSTLISSTLNIIDIWGDMSRNSIFQSWKNTMNWISMISNTFYSVGSIYNSFKGISNANLREYGVAWFKDLRLREAVSGADKYAFILKKDSSIFWTGMKSNGGERVAKNYIRHFEGSSLETILREQGFLREEVIWDSASASLALRSSGQVRTLVGTTPWSGSVWNTVERILLNINPKITGIKEISGVTTQFLPRVFQWGTLLSGLVSSSGGAVGTVYNKAISEE